MSTDHTPTSEVTNQPAGAVEVPGTVSRRVLRGGVLISGCKFAGIGAALASNFALARFTTPDDFGVFILLVTIINFGAIFGRAGLDRALVIYIARSIEEEDSRGAREVFRKGKRISTVASLIAAAIGAGVLFAGGPRFFNLPNSVSLPAAVALGVLLTVRLNVLAESLCGYHDLFFSSLFESQSGGLLMNIAFLCFLTPVAWGTGLTIDVAMWLFVLSILSLVPLAALRLRYVAGRHQNQLRSEKPVSRQLSYGTILTLCFPLMLSQILNFSSSRADIWVAATYCSHRELAFFGAARRLTFLLSMPLMVANHSVLSTIPALYSQNRIAELQRILQISAAIAAIPAAVVLLPLIVLPHLTLELVYGPIYASGSSVLVILSCGQLVASLTGSCGSCLLMTGHHRTMIFTSLAGVVLLVGAGAMAASSFGAVGLAIVCAVTMAAKNVSFLIAARAHIGVWTHAVIPSGISLNSIIRTLFRN